MTAAPDVIETAQALLARGFAVVATAGKKPLDKDWRRRFTEAEILARLKDPGMTGIGFLGELNGGIVPLDFDSEEGERWWNEQCEAGGISPDDFPTVITPGKAKAGGTRRCGKHRYVYDVRGTLTNSQGELKRLGIDVRGKGQCVLPPSPHPDGGRYEWAPRLSLADFDTIPACPDFIYAAIERSKASNGAPNGRARPDESVEKYCRVALENERSRLAHSIQGGRNNTLNIAAMALGTLAHYGAYSEEEARAALRRACEANGLIGDDGLKAFEDTLASGWLAGLAQPRTIPERDGHGRQDGTGAWRAERDQGARFDCHGESMPSDPNLFTVPHWLHRDLPPPDYLLGNLFSTTTRAMLVGPTGGGKTNFGMALNFAIARGTAFLHWRGGRPAQKVIYFDGEMSARLAKERLRQAVERHGDTPDNLIFISRDDFPMMPPLNTEEGQRFANWIIDRAGGIEFITFDNVQSLLLGDMKEEDSWRDTLPWIRDLTRRSIGQLWQHHTGHDTDRGYGTKTREWQLDTVMLMKERQEQNSVLISFDLEFSKARERTPDNRADFAPAHIWLGGDDQWHSSIGPAKGTNGRSAKDPSAQAKVYYEILADAIARSGQRNLAFNGTPPAVTLQQWRDAVIRRGMINPAATSRQQSALVCKYRTELVTAGWIAADGDLVWLPRRSDDAVLR